MPKVSDNVCCQSMVDVAEAALEGVELRRDAARQEPTP